MMIGIYMRVVILGFNTPGIIRFPFEQMTYQCKNWYLVRLNKDNSFPYLDIESKTISVNEDIDKVVTEILK